MNVNDIILCVVLAVVGAAIVWLVVELALTVRRARSSVTKVVSQIEPTIANVEKITTDIQPIIQKADPLVERVSLTVDAANLEIMRVDEILEDVGNITGSVSKTVGAVDTVTSAPLDFVTSATKKIKKKFSPKYASEESVELGGGDEDDSPKNPIVDFIDGMGDVAAETMEERRNQKAERERAAEEQQLKDEARKEKMSASSEKIVNEVSYQVTIDTPDDI